KPIAIKDKLPEGYINPLTHPEVFLKRLKEDPWRITTDGEIQVAIRGLQGDCLIGSKEQAERAKKLLTKFGVPVFIPIEATKRMTEYPILKHLQSNPRVLVPLVKMFEQFLKGYMRPRYKRSELLERREHINKAFRDYFNEPMPKEINREEYTSDQTAIALTFLSYKYSIPFESLKGFYYKIAKKSTHRSRRVDLIIPF
ncbi:MAG TPA: hypothetical protein VHT73_18440, partial [Thermodesulfobacteriota bacterium]|nr:hypothetical protein [Thermodesulfobacteriota bacterium]